MSEDSESNAEGVSRKSEQEFANCLRRRFENSREVFIHLHDVLVWDKPFYPGIVAGVITLVFILLWYFDMSVLTTLSIFGIVACLLDYGVPVLCNTLFDSNKWTSSKERKYEEMCRSMASSFYQVKNMCHSVHQIKETKPIVYFVGVLGGLILTAWIGNIFNNLFLTYLNVLSLTLMPGIKSQPIIQENLSKIMSMIQGVTGGQSKKKK